jgi:dTDP-4-amino-4,6-dideoxygalactose transaminase
VITVEGKRGQEIVDALKASGIGAARTYPETMDVQPPAKAAGTIAHGDLRRSKAFSDNVVNLPLFFGMRDEEHEEAARAVLAVL